MLRHHTDVYCIPSHNAMFKILARGPAKGTSARPASYDLELQRQPSKSYTTEQTPFLAGGGDSSDVESQTPQAALGRPLTVSELIEIKRAIAADQKRLSEEEDATLCMCCCSIRETDTRAREITRSLMWVWLFLGIWVGRDAISRTLTHYLGSRSGELEVLVGWCLFIFIMVLYFVAVYSWPKWAVADSLTDGFHRGAEDVRNVGVTSKEASAGVGGASSEMEADPDLDPAVLLERMKQALGDVDHHGPRSRR